MNEFEIIRKYFLKLSKTNKSSLSLNDDVFFDKSKEIVISVDTYVEGVHFINFKKPELVIKKIVRSSISDLICKGVKPTYYFISGSGNKRSFSSGNLKKISKSLKQEQKKYNSDYEHLDEIYSQMEPTDGPGCKYTTDKNLINFIYSNYIAIHMPEAKIIHCRRNPMDNILSMYRSNLITGHNYTASLEDSARILIAQDQAMQTQKKRHPEKIFTFDYDKFVNVPEVNLSTILDWLGLEFNSDYLHSENSTRSINTASAVEARRPINNKSVGGWKNYEKLLKPALRILQENNIRIS